jgi:hypothetical protein
MNRILVLLCVIAAAGCSTSRVSRYDEFEKVKVDKMVGNDVNSQIFSRTVVCLNAMRETRWPLPATNQFITLQTNFVVSSVTNLTISSSSNEQVAANTNLTINPPSVRSDLPGETGETNTSLSLPSFASDTASGGTTISSARNESLAVAPNQSVFSRNIQRTTVLNNQSTVNTNSQAYTAGSTQTIMVETNMVVTTITNLVVTPHTNVVVVGSDQPAHDYYLFTEIAPSDFPLQPGESLVVLVDGVRHGLTASLPQSGWTGRKGFLTTFYKVQPEVVSGIANAREVKLRIKGGAGAIERNMSWASRDRVRSFLVKSFAVTDKPAGKNSKS